MPKYLYRIVLKSKNYGEIIADNEDIAAQAAIDEVMLNHDHYIDEIDLYEEEDES